MCALGDKGDACQSKKRVIIGASLRGATTIILRGARLGDSHLLSFKSVCLFLDNPVTESALVAVVVHANLEESLPFGGVRDEISFLVYLL